MKITAFAPHLSGRVLPELFSCMPFAKKPRFADDPWATVPHSPTWHWMHTTECGSPNHIGKCTSLPVDRQPWPEIDWLYMPAPPRAAANEHQARNSQQVLKARGPSPDATNRENSAITSPGVGPTGTRQPADAGPAGRQRELFSAAA